MSEGTLFLVIEVPLYGFDLGTRTPRKRARLALPQTLEWIVHGYLAHKNTVQGYLGYKKTDLWFMLDLDA